MCPVKKSDKRGRAKDTDRNAIGNTGDAEQCTTTGRGAGAVLWRNSLPVSGNLRACRKSRLWQVFDILGVKYLKKEPLYKFNNSFSAIKLTA
jgi:hypothetical protein